MNTAMNKDIFWTLIGEANAKYGHKQESAEKWLIKQLVKRGADAAMHFQAIMYGYIDLADKYALCDAASLFIDGGCSDDSFYYFRAWLVYQGKEIYLSALKDPDSLADIEPYDHCNFERLTSVGFKAYSKLTGVDTYDVEQELITSFLPALKEDIVYREGIEYPRYWGGIAKYLPRLYKSYSAKYPIEPENTTLWNESLPEIRRLLDEGRRADRERLEKEQAVPASMPAEENQPLVLESFGHTYPIRMRIGTYCTHNNLAVERDALIDGVWEDWDTLTVNLTPRFRGPNYALIDTNNCGEDCVKWLVKYGFGRLTGAKERSGFCEYPEFEFSEEKLREISAEQYEEHIQLWEAFHLTTWPRSKTGAQDTPSSVE